MPLILELAPLHLPWLHRLGRGNAFERLNAGHLIGAHDVPTQRRQQWSIGVDGADRLDLLGKDLRLLGLGFGGQPVAAAMWLQIGLPLKSVPLNWVKSRQQSGV